MRVLIVCGAGASSTFVAQRLRRAATARGLELTATPSSAAAAPDLLAAADVVLAGAHLGDEVARLGAAAASAAVPFVVLADAARQDGDELLDTTLAAVGAASHGRTS
ncbi:PTS sugar transporter subunit IIB [Protaetiibacter mangrovi]|uniref:PTS IIB subunit n=1 Tax=Protaetiibacter mangrovi TaxID=2970926 RepID=A0ABT1ZD88_9MICO|nr:PTS IIB subunit [Protaetiibacter mangrovi]MCS0498666.1 PTS IIB subunit [Protaetiibacter mangrovi]